jgi:DNA-binding transcriptional ArsR family regulator
MSAYISRSPDVRSSSCDRKERAVPRPARIRNIATSAGLPADLRPLTVAHKALADPTRLRLLQRLQESEATVSQLTRHLDLSQPLVSWHLRRLRAAGLVETRRAGRAVICSLGREALRRFHEQEHALLGMGRSS